MKQNGTILSGNGRSNTTQVYGKRPMLEPFDWLFRRILRRCMRTTNGCWEWQGARVNGRYGQIGFDGKPLRVHRVVYEFCYGPIPEGLFVCHHCDNPPCCNPGHLFVGTPRQNYLDAVRKGRVPVIADDEFTALHVSHQRKSQLRAVKAGRCSNCFKGPLETANHCRQCAERNRRLARRLTGSKPWKPGGPGRPPLRKEA